MKGISPIFIASLLINLYFVILIKELKYKVRGFEEGLQLQVDWITDRTGKVVPLVHPSDCGPRG